MMTFFEQIDQHLFLFLNGLHSPFWDGVMFWMSGKYSWIVLYLLLCWPLYLIYGKRIYIPLIAVALLITLSDQLSVHLFKNVVERYRPCHNADISELVHLVNNKCGGKYGFISSHASNTFALATFLFLQFRERFKLLGYLLLFWAVVVSYSRIYLGVHYPADILAGALFGAVLAVLLNFVLKTSLKRLKLQ